jgi:hypothetical protein
MAEMNDGKIFILVYLFMKNPSKVGNELRELASKDRNE